MIALCHRHTVCVGVRKEARDRQTNWKKCIPFVCLSRAIDVRCPSLVRGLLVACQGVLDRCNLWGFDSVARHAEDLIIIIL